MTLCKNRTFGLRGTPTGGIWSLTNTATMTINGAGVATTTNTGTFGVKYTISNVYGCQNSRTITGTIISCGSKPTSAVNNNDAVSYTMYPNPAKDVVNIKMDMLVGSAELTITDIVGKQVRKQALSLGSNEIDITNLAKGLYTVNITTKDGKKVQKLVVE
ncbi:T9SS C-terminal target domain-containing protein [bacterium]|nr:T9SS C-terminal target domain-containing protein [bacterium]